MNPLTNTTKATLWLSRFPAATPDSFVFPRHRVGLAGHKRAPYLYDVAVDRPMGEWKSAWTALRKSTNLV